MICTNYADIGVRIRRINRAWLSYSLHTSSYDSRTRFLCMISGYILEVFTALPELRSYPQLHRLQQ